MSWESSLRIINKFQKRLFKSIYIGDFLTGFKIQKLILQSKYARLLSIRYVTQICSMRKIPGVDSKIVLSFVERFELNEYLRLYSKNWISNSLKLVSIVQKKGSVIVVQIPTISDRAWHYELVNSVILYLYIRHYSNKA